MCTVTSVVATLFSFHMLDYFNKVGGNKSLITIEDVLDPSKVSWKYGTKILQPPRIEPGWYKCTSGAKNIGNVTIWLATEYSR